MVDTYMEATLDSSARTVASVAMVYGRRLDGDRFHEAWVYGSYAHTCVTHSHHDLMLTSVDMRL